jgi:hypothetical protein
LFTDRRERPQAATIRDSQFADVRSEPPIFDSMAVNVAVKNPHRAARADPR